MLWCRFEPEYEWPTIKQFAHSLVLQMEKNNPALYLTKMTKAARTNKIYLDYLRNDREATAIAAYSTRARPGIPVAVPLDWKELDSSSAPKFYLSTLPLEDRMGRDPWKAMTQSDQQLTEKRSAHLV